MIIGSVAIVGAGFSGSLLAVNLLRHAGPQAVLIERRGDFGRGAAYGTPHPEHLLNVRAASMSALPDRPDHFADWAAAHGLGDGASFVPRRAYGDYLAELLAQADARSGERLTLLHDDVVGATVADDAVTLQLAIGPPLRVEAVVIAAGNLPPHPPPGLDPAVLGPDRYVADPWRADAAAGLTDADTVLLLGTGLTMVDVVLTLDAAGFGGRIVALSRRGLLPQRHAPPGPKGDRSARPAGIGAATVAEVRSRGREIGWRAAVDELRPFTQGMWQAAGAAERARFLRHLRPWWDVHRHRLAPAVADRIAALRASGRLAVLAGKPQAFTAAGRGVAVDWRPRGATAAAAMTVRRIVNCTGPQGDLARSPEPLLRGLLAAGHARADAHGLGLDVDAEARLIGTDGVARPRLFAVGPMTRGAFWEMTAVPDIRTQVWTVARRLAQAHWVEGEGL